MVTQFGMSDLGLGALESESGEVFLGRNFMPQSDYSVKLGDRIDRQIRQIAQTCYDTAKRLIEENRDLCDRLVDILLDVETLDGEEFRKIVAEYTQLPEKKTASVKF
jgi:cell division protease FtsH